MGYLGYYGYPIYWGGEGLWGGGLYPDDLAAGQAYGAAGSDNEPDAEGDVRQADPNLRSGNAIMKYYLHATDGDVGHVQGLIVDEATWAIRYLIVNTSNWWLGHQVVIAPEWIDRVDWRDSTVSVDLSRQAVKDAPEYTSIEMLNREQELRIHQHYGRIGYWRREALPELSGASGHAGTPAPEVTGRRHAH